MTTLKTILNERPATDTPFTPTSTIPKSTVQEAIEYAVATASGDLAAHVAAADPHPQYLTAAEGDALFLTPAEGNAAYQPLDGDLTAIAGLAPSNDDILQRKAGAWVNRSMTQLATDLDSFFLTPAEGNAAYQPLDADLTAWAAVNPSSYSTTAQIAAAYQPLDADLTSWAGVTRAAGFDTFAATPSSANLASLVTGETGSGALMFGTSPSITTDIRPASHDGASLGTAALGFSDAFFGTGAVLTFGAASTPNFTVTHSSGVLTFSGVGAPAVVSLVGAGNAALEIGRADGVASTPFIDFHSGATLVDYDSRIIASGGTGAIGGGTLNIQAATVQVNGAIIETVGLKQIWIPVQQIFLSASPTPVKQTFGVGGADHECIAFDASSAEFTHFTMTLPKRWNGGSISAQFYWTHPATTVNFGVRWGFGAQSHGDDEAFSNSYSSAEVTDTGGTTNDIYISPAMAVTPAGSPLDGDMITCIAYRAAANAADTLAVDAYLLGIMVSYTTNAATDA